jgi:hypothetical protein
LVANLRSTQAQEEELRKAIQTAADYYEKNADRMHYPDFRAQNLFVGSGITEAGCKAVATEPALSLDRRAALFFSTVCLRL